MTEQLVITTAADGRTTLAADAPRPMDERDRPTFTQDRLFNAPTTMVGQLTLGG